MLPPSRRLTRREYLAATACALAAPALRARTASAATRSWRVTGHDIPELAAFDRTIEDFMRLRNIKSGSLAVARNGRLVLARGYSYDDAPDMEVQPTSLFRIASVSKPLTSAAILQLAQAGRLSLSAPITSLVDMRPASGRSRDSRLDQVTILQLLQHLGGWDRDRSFDPMFYDSTIRRALGIGLPIRIDDVITYMAGLSLDSTPGSTYAYSNYGYALLGKAIERVTGVGYEQWMKDAVLSPLGIRRMRIGRSLPQDRAPGEVKYETTYTATTVMDGSGARVPYPYGGFNQENMAAHGAWLASAVDLTRFATAFDRPNESPLLNAASIERTFAEPPTGQFSGGYYYGCGWLVRPRAAGGRNTWHAGSLPGTWTYLVRRFDGINYAALFNQRDDPSDLRTTTYSDIDGALQAAANSVRTWPTHDLFGETLG
jgi:CubicO group peptidase (beta-lactamase class C family)